VTVTCFVAVPLGPVAVRVYVVVALGLTDVLPFWGWLPMPLSIETVVAFVVVHERVEDCPGAMLVGFAVNVAIGGTMLRTISSNRKKSIKAQGAVPSRILRECAPGGTTNVETTWDHTNF
jgi:hypothetical protein